MIYLIDDKKDRQEKDYNWTLSKFEKYKEILTPIYSLDELQLNNSKIFNEATVILYHESFIDKSILKNEAAEKRNELISYANKKGKYLVYFSGGSDTRSLQNNIGNLPDFILYQNLEVFLNHYKKGDTNLEYLLYGIDPEIEQKLKNEIAKRLIETENENTREVKGIQNLFLRPTDDFISTPIINSDNKTLWETSDEYLSKFVKDELNEKQYNNIFIPLCFGDTMSDFNGLKLAIHVRCTETLNQHSNIYIYGFVKIGFLMNHLYFDVLKTKNINLIGFSKQDIYNAASLKKDEITNEELYLEMSKIKLSPPKSYNDNHSLANEWAIYRWAKAINASDDYIERIESKVGYGLYFKYLKTIYPLSTSKELIENELKILDIDDEADKELKKDNLRTPKILYIDDEAEKGWQEIFANLLFDINKIDFITLDIDFKNSTQEELTNSAIKIIKDEDIDLVILDFRLLLQDFFQEDINEITGTKLLKDIKELNPGIQVIMFSATNKIWNLQAFQNAGADGFVFKESPENSFDSNFTKHSISKFLNLVKNSLERNFLKTIWSIKAEVENHFETKPFNKFFPDPMDQLKAVGFQILISEELDLIFGILDSKQQNKYEISMLSIFKILESMVDIFIKNSYNNNSKLYFWDDTEVNFCNYSNGIYQIIPKTNLIEWSAYKSTSNKLQCLVREKLNITDYGISKFIYEISKYRNDYIHPKNRLNLKKINSNKIKEWMENLFVILTSV